MGTDREDILARLRAQIAEMEGEGGHDSSRDSDEDRKSDRGPSDGRKSSMNEDREADGRYARDLAGFEALDREDDEPAWNARRTGAKIDAEAAGSSDAAFRRIVSLASLNEQATSKLRERLVREGYAQGAVEEAIDRATSCGLVSDERYAEFLVRSRIGQGRGRFGIEHELAVLGISFGGLEAMFAELECSEEERAMAVLDQKPPLAKDVRGACYRRLVRKGYSSEVASRASRWWCEHNRGRDAAASSPFFDQID